VTLVAGETAVQITAGAAYPHGTLFVWTGEEALLLLPAAPEHAIERAEATLNGQTLLVWGEYDENGRLLRFADTESRHWITPLDLTEAGDYSLFVTQPIAPDGQSGDGAIWWGNGGQPVEITTSPETGQSLTGFLAANTDLQLTQTEGDNDQHVAALVDAETQELRYTLDASGNWTLVEQAPLTAREYYSDVPFVFLPDDFRGIARGELPAGVERILSMQELDELAHSINFTPEYGCSTHFGSDGRYRIFAVIIGHDTVKTDFGFAITNYEGFWLQTCGVGPNGELVPVIFFANYKGTVTEKGVTTEMDERGRVNFNTWNRATGQVDTTRVHSPTYLNRNAADLIGRPVVILHPVNFGSSEIAHAFADFVNPRRNGFAGIDETVFNYDFFGLQPFTGTVALDKP
jgi:hypothetical protein